MLRHHQPAIGIAKGPDPRGGWRPRCLALLETVEAAVDRWHQRRRLLSLDERALKDIGISRCDAEQEATKRWWS